MFYIKIITLLNQATHPLMGKLAIILCFDDEAVIIEFIDEHWELLNKNIDAVFAGKKIRIMTVDAQKQNKGRRK